MTATSEGAIGSLDLSKKNVRVSDDVAESGERLRRARGDVLVVGDRRASARLRGVRRRARRGGWDAVTGELVFACAPSGGFPGPGTAWVTEPTPRRAFVSGRVKNAAD